MKSSRLGILVVGAVLGLSSISCNGGSKNPMSTGGGGGTGGADVVIHIIAGSYLSGALAYSPDTADVAVGQTVQWVNDDNMVHTATQVPSGFNTGNIGTVGGKSAPMTITGATGLRNYMCNIGGHNMTGALNVTP